MNTFLESTKNSFVLMNFKDHIEQIAVWGIKISHVRSGSMRAVVAVERLGQVSFFFGFLKEKVFHSQTFEDLKKRIKEEIDRVPPEMTWRFMENFRELLYECIAKNCFISLDPCLIKQISVFCIIFS